MSRKEARIASFPTPAMACNGAQVGRIVAVDDQGLLVVEIARTRRSARLAVVIDADRLRQAIEQQQPAVLVFENGDEHQPIVIGLIEAPLPGVALQPTAGTPAPMLEADVDGRRVRLTAQDEIVLECGSASITMRRNGRVIIRGTHVESFSEGTNRIKGGQVRIN